jgi:hypothetical protein
MHSVRIKLDFTGETKVTRLISDCLHTISVYQSAIEAVAASAGGTTAEFAKALAIRQRAEQKMQDAWFELRELRSNEKFVA